MISLLFPIFLLLGTTQAQKLPASPCRGVFDYEPLGTEAGRWYGVIHLFTDSPLRALWLTIELDSKADLLGNWVGPVTTSDNMNYYIENQIKIRPGPPFDVRIFVQYNVLNRAPKLQSIKFNGREICNAASLQPSVLLPDNTESTNRPQTISTQSWVRPTQSTTEVTSQFTTLPPIPPVSQSNQGIPTVVVKGQEGRCGMRYNEVPLIVLGSSTTEGQWPWQVALFETKIANSELICGGTLVTHSHVITAAHCTTVEKSKRLKNKNSLIVFLGRHNLRTSTVGVQISFIEELLVHPQYNPTTYYPDISIITLQDRVMYTNTVQPACLWPESLIPLSNVIGQKGSVVGWGLDFTGVVTEELNLVEMRVVDTETCLRSKNDFFNRFTSNYTFCAGNNDGSSVCNGDSGGGMVFKLNDGSWYLRGVVSLSVSKPDANICDPNHYMIFTDVAKLLPWIKNNINDN